LTRDAVSLKRNETDGMYQGANSTDRVSDACQKQRPANYNEDDEDGLEY